MFSMSVPETESCISKKVDASLSFVILSPSYGLFSAIQPHRKKVHSPSLVDPFCVNVYMFSVFHPQFKEPQVGFIDTKLSVGVWVSIYFRPGVQNTSAVYTTPVIALVGQRLFIQRGKQLADINDFGEEDNQLQVVVSPCFRKLRLVTFLLKFLN